MSATLDPQALPAIPLVKGRFPFRLGTTSYVYPADILYNVRRLAGRIDAVQLILFEGGEGNIPTPAEISELAVIGADHGLDYIVHFPIDYRLADADEAKRRLSLQQHCRVAQLTAPLAAAFVLHGEASRYDRQALAWLDAAFAELRRHLPAAVPVCLENLGYDFSLTDGLRAAHDLHACIDLGHLALNGLSPETHWQRYRNEAAVVHLHGFRDGRDHLSLRQNSAEANEALRRLLMAFEGTVILELFSFDETVASLEYLQTWLS
jgi:sugar phosphate isomerase/epimerase